VTISENRTNIKLISANRVWQRWVGSKCPNTCTLAHLHPHETSHWMFSWSLPLVNSALRDTLSKCNAPIYRRVQRNGKLTMVNTSRKNFVKLQVRNYYVSHISLLQFSEILSPVFFRPPDWLCPPPPHYPTRWLTGAVAPVENSQSVTVTTHFHAVLSLRISGAQPLFLLYALKACTGTVLQAPHVYVIITECVRSVCEKSI
jgi:hypothetical protein